MAAVEDPIERVAIGVAFGNSYSSIAINSSGDLKVIANEEGDRQIPSILAYVEGEEFHGTQAKAQIVRNAGNTCASFRDFLGKKFDEIDVPVNFAAQPFSQDGQVAYRINDGASEEASILSVQEITTRHLRRLKDSATDYIGQQVTAAVITVPTDFGAEQKRILTAASADAGLEVIQLISEPVAALLAHDRRVAPNSSSSADRLVVVADLGATRTDAALISVRGGLYTILATQHDRTIGGSQLDLVLMDHFAKEFLKKNKNAADPRSNPRSLAKLRLESEAVKKALSLGASAGFNVESLSDGLDYSATINRSRFELLAGKHFTSFTQLITSCVTKAGLDVLDVDEVLVTGGSAHIPRIAQTISSAFPSSTKVIAPATDAAAVNPSELTVRGAALQAFLIHDYDTADITENAHPVVTAAPHLSQALGFVVADSKDASPVFHPILPAETPLPVRRTVTFKLKQASGESGVLLKICEGLRDIKITEAPPKPSKEERRAAAKAAGLIDDDDEEDDDDDDDDEDEEPSREKQWRIGNVVAEVALKDASKDSKINLQLSVGINLDVNITAAVGGKTGGVRGTVAGQDSQVNGSAAPNGQAH